MAGKGFTVVELLIVVGITVVLAAAAAPIYSNLQVSTQLDEASAQITQDLRLAREQSRAGVYGVSHGVLFGANSYTLYQGASYAARDATYDQINTFSKALAITTTFPGNEVTFTTGTGAPSATGTIVVAHDVSGTRTILVNDIGAAAEQ